MELDVKKLNIGTSNWWIWDVNYPLVKIVSKKDILCRIGYRIFLLFWCIVADEGWTGKVVGKKNYHGSYLKFDRIILDSLCI